VTFKICDKCKSINIQTLIFKLKQLNENAKIEIGCQNFCGIGRSKPFIIVDHIPIIAENEEELVEKVRDFLSNKS